MGFGRKWMGAVVIFGLLTLPGLAERGFSRELDGNGIDRGGGQGVENGDGSVRLRDLLTGGGTCTWIEAFELFERVGAPGKKLLGTVRTGDQKAYYEILNQSLDVQVCLLSGRLRSLPVSEQDELTIYVQGAKQVAVRVEDEIYLDEGLFEKMPGDDRAALFLHEMLHPYTDRNSPTRMLKLRTFVKTIAGRSGGAFTPEEFQKIEVANRVFISSWRSTPTADAVKTAFYRKNPELLNKLMELDFVEALSPEFVDDLLDISDRGDLWEIPQGIPSNLNQMAEKLLSRFSRKLNPSERSLFLGSVVGNASIEALKVIAESGPWDPLEKGTRSNALSPLAKAARQAVEFAVTENAFGNYSFLLDRLSVTLEPAQLWEMSCEGIRSAKERGYSNLRFREMLQKMAEIPLFKNSIGRMTCGIGDGFHWAEVGVAASELLAEAPSSLSLQDLVRDLEKNWRFWPNYENADRIQAVSPNEAVYFEELVGRVGISSGGGDSSDADRALYSLMLRVEALGDRFVNREKIDRLFSQGVGTSSFDHSSWYTYQKSPLMLATRLRLPETVKVLLSRPQRVLVGVEATFLAAAIHSNSSEVLKAYIQSGRFDVNARWEDHSALYHAYCNREMRRILEEAGAERGFFEGKPSCPAHPGL